MSRLTRGVHTVTVTPRIETIGPRGAIVQSFGQPQKFQCNVKPASTDEREAVGVTVETVYRIKYFPQAHGGKPWAGGTYSRITWDGREFEQIGEGLISSRSPRTGHVKILMKARSSTVK